MGTRLLLATTEMPWPDADVTAAPLSARKAPELCALFKGVKGTVKEVCLNKVVKIYF